MATIFLKFEGKRGDFADERRCFLMARNVKHDKDGNVLLFPVEYRSTSELQATVERLKGELDAAVKKAKRELKF